MDVCVEADSLPPRRFGTAIASNCRDEFNEPGEPKTPRMVCVGSGENVRRLEIALLTGSPNVSGRAPILSLERTLTAPGLPTG